MNGTITKRTLGKGRFASGYCFDQAKIQAASAARSLARISHRPSVVTGKRETRLGFPRAMINPPFWNGIAELSRLHKGQKTVGKIFSSIPKPMASTAPHSLWRGLDLQV